MVSFFRRTQSLHISLPLFSSLCILPPQTVKTCEVFLDNYTQIYFLAIACKTHFKSNSYPWKLSCALLSLMNERAVPVLSEDDDLDDFVASFNEDNASDTVTEVPTRHPISPTFYTMLLFHRAFCEYTFNDNFDFLKRNDLYFGSGTFGQLARFMPVQVYVMHKQLEELKNGGWKKKKPFEKYVEALKGIPQTSANEDNKADQAFFEDMSKKFLSIYENTLNDHLLKRWRSEKLLWYGLGGDEKVAKEMAGWLLDAKLNGGGVEVNRDGEEVNNSSTYDDFTPGEIKLCKQHNTPKGEPVKIELDECMKWLTDKKKTHIIIEEGFIGEHWEDIEKMAMADNTVRLFDYKDDGKTLVVCICYIFTNISNIFHSPSLLIQHHKDVRREQSTRIHGMDTTTLVY